MAQAQGRALASCFNGQTTSESCKAMIANYWQFEAMISRVAKSEGIDPALMKALVAVESGYNHRAISSAGARGLTQVMPTTSMDMGINSNYLFEPEINLIAGTRYLALQWKTFRDWELALAAYNAGPQAVIRNRGIPPFPETQAYVVRVLYMYQQFKGQSSVAPLAEKVTKTKPNNSIQIIYAQNSN